jgi:tetratricopeptide (TPR) repeat protein
LRYFIKISFIVFITQLIYIPLLHGQNSRTNLENKFRLGKSYERSGEIVRAENIFNELVNEQPWNQLYVKALNDVYISQKKYDLSISLLERSIKANNKDINFYGMLGTTYYIMNNKEQAYRTWESAIDASSNKHIIYKLISNFALENRDFDKAIEYLKEGKKIASDKQTFSMDLARIYVANMKYKNAVYEYCDILVQRPIQLESAKRFLESFIKRPGAAKEVEDAINEYLNEKDNRTIKELLAYVYIIDNKPTEAFELINEIDKNSNSEGIVLYKFAQELFADGEYSTALKSFESITSNYPDSKFYSSAKLGFARSLEAITDNKLMESNIKWKSYNAPDSAISEIYSAVINTYETLSNQFRNSQIASEAYLRVANILFYKQNNPTKAVQKLESIVSSTQHTNYFGDAYFLLGKINVYINKLDDAYSFYQKSKLSRGITDQIKRSITFEQAKIYFWKNNFSEALKLLNTVISHLQDDIANDALELALLINTTSQDSLNLVSYSNALLYAEQGKFKEAYQTFEDLSKLNNSMMISKFANYKRAEMLVAQSKYGTAIEILDQIESEDNSGLYNDKSLFLKGNIYHYALGDFENAKRTYQNLLENYPNSLYFDKSREIIQKLNNLEEPTI